MGEFWKKISKKWQNTRFHQNFRKNGKIHVFTKIFEKNSKSDTPFHYFFPKKSVVLRPLVNDQFLNFVVLNFFVCQNMDGLKNVVPPWHGY